MKICFKCGKDKELSEFYKHNGMADGRLNKCKECTKMDTKKRIEEKRKDIDWVRKERARGREKFRRLYSDVKQTCNNETSKKYRQKNPIKWRAVCIVNNAIKYGKILRQGCSCCGAKAQAHHFDYTKPLSVVWYCSKHHSRVHRYMRYHIEEYGKDFIPRRIK